MISYRNPSATWTLAVNIRDKLTKLNMSGAELGRRVGLSKSGKIDNLLSGRHYFPIELASPICKEIGLDECAVIRLILQQYFRDDVVEYIFSTIEGRLLKRVQEFMTSHNKD